MASISKIREAVDKLVVPEQLGMKMLVPMSEVFGALREYALKYGYKMRDLHELNKATRSL